MQIWEISATFVAALLAAHLLGEFVLPTRTVAQRRRRVLFASCFLHALPHAILAYILAGYWRLWPLPVLILLTHFVIDFVKDIAGRYSARQLNAEESPKWKMAGFAAIQVLHVAVILALSLLILPQTDEGFWSAVIGRLWPTILVIACGATICIGTGGFVIGILIQPFLSEIENHPQGTSAPETIGVPKPRGFPNGGRVIGQLERLLIFVLILNGQYTAVGFLVAAKSIFRFGELNDPAARMESEYVIIGTMMSFAWAIVTSWATAYVLQTFPR